MESGGVDVPLHPTDIPTYTVDLGGEYKVTHVGIITADSAASEFPTIADGKLTPATVSMAKDSVSGTTFTDVGVFGASEAIKTLVYSELTTPTVGTKVKLTAFVEPETASTKAISQLRFCGFKVYGAKTPMQVLLEAEK